MYLIERFFKYVAILHLDTLHKQKNFQGEELSPLYLENTTVLYTQPKIRIHQTVSFPVKGKFEN